MFSDFAAQSALGKVNSYLRYQWTRWLLLFAERCRFRNGLTRAFATLTLLCGVPAAWSSTGEPDVAKRAESSVWIQSGPSKSKVTVSDAGIVTAASSHLGSDYTLIVHDSGRVANLVVPPVVASELATGTDSAFARHVQWLTVRLYNHLRDSFDFVILVSDQDSLPSGAAYFGISIPVKNDTRGLGQPVFDNGSNYGARGKLQQVIHLTKKDALLGGPSLHEIMHRWANYLSSINTQTGGSDYAHWGFSGVGGQLGGWAPGTLVSLGNGRYSASSGRPGDSSFGTYANGGNSLPFAKLELYLMGLIPASEVPDIQIAQNPSWNRDETFNATGFTTVTPGQIVKVDGARIPDYTSSAKVFRALYVVISPVPVVGARLDSFASDVQKFSHAGADSSSLFNFWEATGGRAQIEMGGLQNEIVAPPTVPGTPTPSAPGTASSPGTLLTTLTPTLSWSAVTGATGYGVYVSDQTAGGALVYDNDSVANVTSIVLPSGTLTNGRVYRWNMRARNSSGFSGYSTALYFRSPTPTQPTDGVGVFDYPIGSRGYAEGVPVPIVEFPSGLVQSPGGGTEDANTLFYGDGVANPIRENNGSSSSWWVAQDVGAFNAGYGIHAAEDWNRGSGAQDRGESIFAAAAGDVLDIRGGTPETFWTIVLQHDLGGGETAYTIYGHVCPSSISGSPNISGALGTIADFGFSKGKRVSRGDLIARIGDLPIGPHLHFEIRVNTVDSSPKPYFFSGGATQGSGQRSIIAQEVSLAYGHLRMAGIVDPSDFIDAHRPGRATAPNFTINTSTSPTGGGSTAGGGSKVSGASVSVVASAASGYSFVNWTENGNVVTSSSTYTFIASSNRTLVANFRSALAVHSVTVSSSPSSGGNATGSGSYSVGTEAILSANPSLGYAFVSWTEGGSYLSGSNPLRITVGVARTLIANFASTTAIPGAVALSADAPLWDSATGAPKVRLTWTSAAGTAAYDLYRNGSLHASGLAPSLVEFTDASGLVPGVTYIYRLVARNPVGQTEASRSVAISAGIRPGQPDLLVEGGSFSFSPINAVVGGTITVNLRIKNGGAAAVSASQVRLALRSSEDVPFDVKSQLALLDVSGLPAGGSQSFSVSANLSGIPAGRYRLAAVLIPSEGVIEVSRVNNDDVAGEILTVTSVSGEGLRIIRPPSDQLVRDGQTVNLTVVADGTGLNFQWFRDGSPIGPPTATAQLTFTARPAMSAYNYKVKVVDASDNAWTSDPVKVLVLTSPEPPFDTSAQDSVILVGEERINPDWPTLIVTHGWQGPNALSGSPAFPPLWTMEMTAAVQSKVPAETNVLVYWWKNAYIPSLEYGFSRTEANGSMLAKKLWGKLGDHYDKPIHFIGHSLGTMVNAHAIKLLPNFSKVQATILDAPTTGIALAAGSNLATNSFFQTTLATARYVDNFFGDVRIFSAVPILGETSLTPAVGTELAIAATNERFYGADHGEVHKRYLERVVGSSWVTIVNGLFDNLHTAIELFKGIPVGNVSFTPSGNVAATTPMVGGQIVPALQLNVSGGQGSLGLPTASRLVSREVSAAMPLTSIATLSADIIVPSETTHFDFDLLVDQAGDGSWLSVSFNGEELLEYRGDAFWGDEFRPVSLQFGAFAGRAGLLRIALNGKGTQASRVTLANIQFKASPVPLVRTSPSSQSIAAGQPIKLSVEAGGVGPFSYQWRKDGVPILGATSAIFTIQVSRTNDAGSYTVDITNVKGATTSEPAVVTVRASEDAGRLSNLSVRTRAGTGSQTLIVGVSIGGTNTLGSKPVLFRAMGPSLAPFGIPGLLEDPRLTVFQAAIAVNSNDDWGGVAPLLQMSSAVGAFPFQSPTSKDAAIGGNFSPGSYTIQVSGPNTGAVLAEIYDATSAQNFTVTTPRLINISARSHVGNGGDILITGLVVSGLTPKQVLLRAVGPGLSQFGVSEVLADPTLTVYQWTTPFAANDNWKDSANADAIASAAAQVGAFPLLSGGKDAAALVTLNPGSYTVHVNGVRGTTGVALVEIYEVP